MSSHSIRRFNKLIETFGLQRYLEVGVKKGETFVGIEAEHKTAVDPKFMFDAKDRAARTRELFHETTSDDFFININNDMYDLIFLDGLHTFEQTFRDFCNAIMVIAPQGIIVVDDTIPVDIYSAHRDPNECRELRKKEIDSDRGGWHGDVYKTIFAIAEFFPLWSYRTISRGGNPQTILWQKQRPVVGRFDSLETISRLDYFTFIKNMDVMNLEEDWGAIVREVRQDYKGIPRVEKVRVSEPDQHDQEHED